MDTTIESRILTFVVATFPNPEGRELSADDPLLESGIVDSAGIFDLVDFLESEFSVKIDDEEIVPEHFETVTALAAFVRRKQSA